MNNIIYNPKPGQIFDSINGPFEFVEELPPKYTYGTAIRYCKIRFVNTGTVKEVKLQSIFNNNIKDPYFKSVARVGYLGDTSNIQYTKKEYDYIIEQCMFKDSKDKLDVILEKKIKGWSNVELSQYLNISEPCLSKRLEKINKKIRKVL